MEAPPGFEPGYVGIKTQCLSTWLRGYLRVAKKVFIYCKHLFDIDYLSVFPLNMWPILCQRIGGRRSLLGYHFEVRS